MKREHLPWVAAGASAALIWLASWHRSAGDSRAHPAAEESATARTSAAVASAPQKLPPAPRPAAAAPAPNAVSAAEPAAAEAAPEEPYNPFSPEAIERERRQFQSYFATLDAKRATERRDNAWAAQVQEQVQTVMKQEELLAQSSIVAVDCGATLCRIEAKHENPIAKRLFVNLFLTKVGGLLPEATLYAGAPDELRTVSHFAREGTSLPRIHLQEGPEADQAQPEAAAENAQAQTAEAH